MHTLQLTKNIFQELGIMLATIFTTAGAEWSVRRLTDAEAHGSMYIAWGTGAGTSQVSDTTLFTEASEDRVVVSETTPSADTIQWEGTITADGAKTITNAGIFNASSGGSLVVKADFSGRELISAGESITFTVQLQSS